MLSGVSPLEFEKIRIIGLTYQQLDYTKDESFQYFGLLEKQKLIKRIKLKQLEYLNEERYTIVDNSLINLLADCWTLQSHVFTYLEYRWQSMSKPINEEKIWFEHLWGKNRTNKWFMYCHNIRKEYQKKNKNQLLKETKERIDWEKSEILRGGKVDHHGEFFNIVIEFPRTAQTPVLISTLGKKAFQLAGEIADGALSWMCPVPYLLHTGIPLLRKAATANGRSNPPPLVAHVPVALSQDRDSVMVAGHKMFEMYAKLPFYAKMFADAGFPLTSDNNVSDDLVINMIISGNEDTIAASLTKLLDAGLDELMVSLVPVVDEDHEQTQLMRLIGQL